MERRFPESDWKGFRQVQALALDRFCQRVLTEVNELAADTGRSSHERYLAVYKLLQHRHNELAAAFDDSRRSTAFVQLARIRAAGLLSDKEFASFSAETRALVQVFLDMWRE